MNRPIKAVDQLIHDPLGGLDRRKYELVRINGGQVQLKPNMVHPLGKENPLGTAIPFPEGVEHINGMIEVCHFLSQLVVAQVFGLKLLQPPETSRGARLDLLHRNKRRAFFRKIDLSELARPIVEVTKEELVDALVVVKVISPLDGLLIQKGGLAQNDGGFYLRQFILVPDVQLIDETSGPLVAVVGGGFNTISHRSDTRSGGDQLQVLFGRDLTGEHLPAPGYTLFVHVKALHL